MGDLNNDVERRELENGKLGKQEKTHHSSMSYIYQVNQMSVPGAMKRAREIIYPSPERACNLSIISF